MNRFILFFILTLQLMNLTAADISTYIKSGNKYYDQRNHYKKSVESLSMINKAIHSYKEGLKIQPKNEILLFKYTQAKYFKYTVLHNKYSVEDKKKMYTYLIKRLESAYKHNKKSKYINCALTIAWGRFGKNISKSEALSNGVVGKIKLYGENLYKLDKNFERQASMILMGRLHYRVPYIPLILSWPDIDESKKFLEDAIKNQPDNLMGKLFLADTLYELDETERAIKYYKEIHNFKPSRSRYHEDLNVIAKCKKSLKEKDIEF